MDIAEIKAQLILLRERMRDENVHLDGAILFGSRAKGTSTPDSDIDLAIISRDFGKDRHNESVLLQRLCYDLIPYADLVPVGVADYLDPHPLSPNLERNKEVWNFADLISGVRRCRPLNSSRRFSIRNQFQNTSIACIREAASQQNEMARSAGPS